MGNKIIVEFDKDDLQKNCEECPKYNKLVYTSCKKDNKQQVQCYVMYNFKNKKIMEFKNEIKARRNSQS